MKPYGWKRGMWRDEDGGPPSKYRKMKSKDRKAARRTLHKGERVKVKRELPMLLGE